MNETTKKYKKLDDLLEKISSSTEFKNRKIEGSKKLKDLKSEDIKQLKIYISNEMKKDGINKIFVNGKTIRQIKD